MLQNFQVGQFWVGHNVDSRAYYALLYEARGLGIPIVHRRSGESFAWGKVTGRFLWPPNDAEVAVASNDDSVVLSLRDGSTRFLLPGDIQKDVEQKLIQDGDPLGSAFLKVPHHGSKTSSSQSFLAAVHPEYAVISVGAHNTFGLPSPEVMDRYRHDGIALWRTDRDGAVTAFCWDNRVTIMPFVRADR